MKKQIRTKVFETNSSSVHSITIRVGSLQPSTLEVNWNNKVEVEFGEFGWEICDYNSQYSKLQYILTMCAIKEGRNIDSVEDFYNTSGFLAINEAVAEHCKCDGIEIVSKMWIEKWSDGENTLGIDGYIDHQSTEDYTSVEDFLSQNGGLTVEEFIFNNGVFVSTDNDNH